MEFEHYTDGKVREENVVDLEQIKAEEQQQGIQKVSPFGVNNKLLFLDMLEKMPLEKMNYLASKVGVPEAADLEEQKKILKEAFADYQRKCAMPVEKTEEEKIEIQDAKTKVLIDMPRTKSIFETKFAQFKDYGSFKRHLIGMTLSDLQNIAAQAGFNPTFDKKKLILNLAGAFENDLRKRKLS
jgi:hypothetical protein